MTMKKAPRLVKGVLFLIIRGNHQIHQHAGDADIQPNRHGPACDFPVPFHLHLQAANHREKGQKHGGGGQNDMGDQDEVIYDFDPPFAAVRSGRRQRMINQISDQKRAVEPKAAKIKRRCMRIFFFLMKYNAVMRNTVVKLLKIAFNMGKNVKST